MIISVKMNKEVYVKNDVMTSVIVLCNGERRAKEK